MGLKDILMSDNPVAVLRAMDKNGTLGQLEPSLAALRMEMRAGFHHKDNLTHSMQVLQNAIDMEPGGADLVLRTAALFHDIGKPATRKFVGKSTVTFQNHETVGAHMVRKILKAHGYSRAEINEIAKIVAFHMRSHGFGDVQWTPSAVRRLITEVGSQETMDRLIIIFYSDITTKFDSKKSALHKSIDALIEAMDEVKALDARRSLRPALNGNEVMELFNLTPGRELGKIMKYLNTDEGVALSRDEAIEVIKTRFM